MLKKNKIILIIVIIFMAAGLIFVFSAMKKVPSVSQNNQIEAKVLVKSITKEDHIKGDINAPVQVIIYSNFACPFSAKFNDTMKKIEENFKDKVVIAFRQYPLLAHVQALKAAEASECAAEQNKFWEMHDKLFIDNADSNMSVEQYKKDASDLGLNQEQFDQCIDSAKYEEKINQQKIGGDEAGAIGTPTIFVNGNIYPGAYPFEDFTASDGQQDKGMKSIINEL